MYLLVGIGNPARNLRPINPFGFAEKSHDVVNYDRARYREFYKTAVDFAERETPASIAASLLEELCGGCTQLEVGYRDGERFVVGALPSNVARGSSHAAPAGVWVVSGGGRGVTARLTVVAPHLPGGVVRHTHFFM